MKFLIVLLVTVLVFQSTAAQRKMIPQGTTRAPVVAKSEDDTAEMRKQLVAAVESDKNYSLPFFKGATGFFLDSLKFANENVAKTKIGIDLFEKKLFRIFILRGNEATVKIQKLITKIVKLMVLKLNDVNDIATFQTEKLNVELETWGKQQITKSGNTSEEMRATVNNFIDTKTEDFKTCINSIVNDTQQLFNQVKDFISQSNNLVNKMIRKAVTCSKIPRSKLEELPSCISSVINMVGKMIELPHNMTNFERKLVTVGANGVSTLQCIADTNNQIRESKFDIEAKIDAYNDAKAEDSF